MTPTWLLGALLAAAVPAASAPPPGACPTPAGPPAGVSLDLAAPAFGFWTLPPCTPVEFQANGVTGRPPLTLTWDTDLGETFQGNPITLDTSTYTGFHRITVHVTNAYGTASLDSFFRVDPLSVPTPIATSQNPSPDLTISVLGAPIGATQWRWLWGDGTSTPWTSDCSALEAFHTYSTPGTYSVRLEARSCTEGPLASSPLTVTVGETTAISILVWQVQGCQSGFCVFSTSDLLVFDQLVTALPDRYDYDWNGDGTTDQTSLSPIPTHLYPAPGTYRPILTVHLGTSYATRQHQDFILVTGAPPPPPIFEDGFESEDLSRWSRAVGD